MSGPTKLQLLHGTDTPTDAGRRVTAGPVTAILEGADLRDIRFGDVEVAQRIYLAVRDDVWNTVPAKISDLKVDAAADHFEVTFTAHHAYADIDFSWKGQISGAPDGTITYQFDGTAGRAFRYAKIGFNLHHALAQAVGRPYEAEGPGGKVTGVLPDIIDPQRLVEGRLTAIFEPYDRLTLHPTDKVRVELTFDGDLFEMQDHRNWTDANYKSYGTPLSVPWPMDATPGQRFYQKVTIRAFGDPGRRVEHAPVVRVSTAPSGRLPAIGSLLMPEHLPLSKREIDLLRRLGLDHIRVDVYLEDDDWRGWLHGAAEACKSVGAPAELAVFVTSDTEGRLAELAGELRESGLQVARVLVFSEGRGFAIGRQTTPARLMETVRAHLRDVVGSVPFAGGTNQFFAEINRQYPERDAVDGAVYSINPQTHACDDRSVMENLQGQEDTVATTNYHLPGKPVHVTPVTLVGRFGPYPGGPPDEGGLPGNVDVRQPSMLTAAWTVGTIRHFAQAGAASLTLFELVGWRGLVERDKGSPMGEFPSVPGMVFPVHDVLTAIAPPHAWKTAQVDASPSAVVEALAVTRDGTTRVLVANITGSQQRVDVTGLEGHDAAVERVNADTVAAALTSPRVHLDQKPVRVAGQLGLTLDPYEVDVITAVSK
jgi:D-apionolactonase